MRNESRQYEDQSQAKYGLHSQRTTSRPRDAFAAWKDLAYLTSSGTDRRTNCIDSPWDVVHGISATIGTALHSSFAAPDEPLTSQVARDLSLITYAV